MPELLTTIVPESLAIIILLLILSASMSTLASLVLMSSSSLAKDFYHGFINKNISDKNLTLLMRVSSAFFVMLSATMALMKPATIVAILGISWRAIGAAFLGPFVWGLLNKKASKTFAIASCVIGLAVTIILFMRGSSSPEAGTIGMIISLVIPSAGLFSKS